MKKQAIVFDAFGNSLIVYSAGVFCWSFSINGAPGGKSFLTRARACKYARKAAFASRPFDKDYK
jgi:hypothetical protein